MVFILLGAALGLEEVAVRCQNLCETIHAGIGALYEGYVWNVFVKGSKEKIRNAAPDENKAIKQRSAAFGNRKENRNGHCRMFAAA